MKKTPAEEPKISPAVEIAARAAASKKAKIGRAHV